MNNYNDFYNYINGYSEMNYMTNPNNMIGDLNLQNIYPNNNNTNQNNNDSSLEDSEDLSFVVSS